MPFERLNSRSLVAYALAIAMVLAVAVVAIRNLDAAAADRLDAMRTLEQKVTARFSVTDTGPGIAPAHLDHVFDRYWKQDGETVKGTGLGLFIARSIVEAHDGHILAASPQGSGATFTFTLPAESSAADRSPASVAAVGAPGQGSADLMAGRG